MNDNLRAADYRAIFSRPSFSVEIDIEDLHDEYASPSLQE